jgi:hypothetical protein
MPFLMDAIDAGGTRRRLEDVTASGMREFEEVQQRSAQVDEEFKAARAEYEAEAAAMDKLVADAKAAQQPKSDEDEQARTGPWARRDAKPTIHAFGGEEFAEDPRTEPTGIRVPPLEAPPAPPPPAPPSPTGVEPVRELAFGYEDEDTGAVAVPPDATRRPAPGPEPADDDDLSGRSWMR